MCKIIFQFVLCICISFQLVAQSRPIKSLTIGNQWFYEEIGWYHPCGSYSCSFSYLVTNDTLIDNEKFYRI